MKSKYTPHYSLVIVLLAHAVALSAALYAHQAPTLVVIEPPTIQGMIVSSEPITKPPEPTPPPPPEVKPKPVPKIPMPKGPASERAITQETQAEPTPPVEKPVKDAEPAPVVPPQAEASELNNPRPPYPQMSTKLREEGTVLLEVLVKADGSLGEMRLKTSSGFKRLDDSALRTVKNWHFVPAKRGGEAIDFWYELPIEFSLNK